MWSGKKVNRGCPLSRDGDMRRDAGGIQDMM